MAREGLRTLVVGKRVLTEEQYVSFEVSADPVTGSGCGCVPLASCMCILSAPYLRQDTSKRSSASQTGQPRYCTASEFMAVDNWVQGQRLFTAINSCYLCFNYTPPDWFIVVMHLIGSFLSRIWLVHCCYTEIQDLTTWQHTAWIIF